MECMSVWDLTPFRGKHTLAYGHLGICGYKTSRDRIRLSALYHVTERVHTDTRTTRLTQACATPRRKNSRTSLKPHVFLLLGLPQGSDAVGVLLRKPHHASLRKNTTQNLHYSPLKTKKKNMFCQIEH